MLQSIFWSHAIAIFYGIAVGLILFLRYKKDDAFWFRFVVCVPLLAVISVGYSLLMSAEVYHWTIEEYPSQVIFADTWVALVCVLLTAVVLGVGHIVAFFASGFSHFRDDRPA